MLIDFSHLAQRLKVDEPNYLYWTFAQQAQHVRRLNDMLPACFPSLSVCQSTGLCVAYLYRFVIAAFGQ